MAEISRREFFKKVATDAAVAGFMATGVVELHANPLGLPIGSQTYPHRAMLKQDFPGLMKQLADLGVQRIELCSPLGYADFAGLAKGAEVKKILADHGLKCESASFQHEGAQANSRSEHCLGQRGRHHADDDGDPGRGEQPDHG